MTNALWLQKMMSSRVIFSGARYARAPRTSRAGTLARRSSAWMTSSFGTVCASEAGGSREARGSERTEHDATDAAALVVEGDDAVREAREARVHGVAVFAGLEGCAPRSRCYRRRRGRPRPRSRTCRRRGRSRRLASSAPSAEYTRTLMPKSAWMLRHISSSDSRSTTSSMRTRTSPTTSNALTAVWADWERAGGHGVVVLRGERRRRTLQ